MTSLLLLAQEALERATNPAYGVTVNDEYAARLAAVLGPEDIERFASEVALLDDAAALTPYGWTWVLEFALGRGITLDRALLADLCQRWDEPALKALAIETALNPALDDRSVSDNEEWLEEVIERAAPLGDTSENDVARSLAEEPAPPDAVDISSAEALLTAFLIVGTRPALSAAQRLLDRSWSGAGQLAAFVADRLDDSDPLASVPWTVLRP